MRKTILFMVATLFVPTLWAAEADTTRNLNEVVVTGSQVKVSRNHLPQTISVITREQIEASSESALLPVLSERVPGVFVSERGVTGFGVSAGSAGQINIRGVGSGTRVLTMFDGQPQWAGIFGHHLPDTYVASDVERVEVVRGPASLLYGSNAMGGVINIITRNQEKKGFNWQQRIMYGSYNTQKYMGTGGYANDKLNATFSINHDHTDGHRERSKFWITNGFGKVSYKLSNNWKATGDITLAKFFSENPGSVMTPVFDNWVDVLRGTASASIENEYEKTSGAVKLYYNFGDHKIDDGYKTDEKPKEYLFRSNDHVSGITAYQSVRLFQGNTLTAGIDYKNWGGKARQAYADKDVELVDKTVNEIGVYVMAQQSLFDKLSLSAGVRLESNSQFGSEWVPQAGVSYHPFRNTTLKASYSKGFRSPNIKDLYMFMTANPDLLPERIQNYDISIIQRFLDGKLNVEVNGFVANGDNLIQTVTIEGKPKNINTGRFNNKGVEVGINYHLNKSLAFTCNYSFLSMDNPIVAAPEHQLFIAGDYRLKKFLFNLSYQYIGGLYLTTGTDPLKENFGLVNAKVSYNPIRQLTFFVKGENLMDQTYTINNGFPMPGITCLGGINVSF